MITTKVPPELIRDFVSMLGPKKPNFIMGHIADIENIRDRDVYVITFYISEELKKKLNMDKMLDLHDFLYLASEKISDKEEYGPIATYIKELVTLKKDIKTYFSIKEIKMLFS